MSVTRAPSTVATHDESDRSTPGILCWNCRNITPFLEDRCRACGAAFAGSTGGAYAPSTGSEKVPAYRKLADPRSQRGLAELLEDLHRIETLAASLTSPIRHEGGETVTLFQCPACGRFVSEQAATCACGVRFSDATDMVPCPECDSLVPGADGTCHVCGTRVTDGSARVAYGCPRCGAQVEAEAVRCACGVWFED